VGGGGGGGWVGGGGGVGGVLINFQLLVCDDHNNFFSDNSFSFRLKGERSEEDEMKGAAFSILSTEVGS